MMAAQFQPYRSRRAIVGNARCGHFVSFNKKIYIHWKNMPQISGLAGQRKKLKHTKETH